MRFVSLVLGLGLEHSCPWPRECLSSERLSLALALAWIFSVSLALALASSLVSSTPPLLVTVSHQAHPQNRSTTTSQFTTLAASKFFHDFLAICQASRRIEFLRTKNGKTRNKISAKILRQKKPCFRASIFSTSSRQNASCLEARRIFAEQTRQNAECILHTALVYSEGASFMLL